MKEKKKKQTNKQTHTHARNDVFLIRPGALKLRVRI